MSRSVFGYCWALFVVFVISFIVFPARSAATEEPRRAAVAGITCVACKIVVAELEAVAQSKGVDAQLEAYLENNVCSLLPVNMAAGCVSLVTKYSAELLSVVAFLLPPDLVCGGIDLCEQSHFFPLHKPPHDANTTLCESCTMVGETILSQLTSPSTESDLVDTIASLCKLITDPTDASTCSLLISQYGTALVDVLFRSIDPEMACCDLGLC